MPSGPAHLHARFVNDSVAWDYLRRRGFKHKRFVISPPYRQYQLTKGESDAIDYLWMEWDWAYAPSEAHGTCLEATRVYRARAWLSRVSSGPLRVRDAYLARLRHRLWSKRDLPVCYGSNPGPQEQAENDCLHCKLREECLD